MDNKDESFPKSERLTKTHQFQQVYNHGYSIANNLIVMYMLKKKQKQRRIGFSVSKKIGNAVVRNRIKRILKEIYRRNKNKLITNIDLVLIGRKRISDSSYQEIKRAVFDLFEQAKII
ncbi:ribonuclease P protein component [Acetohalobium arabaticum]|uniref:Ribonuclease P protein component n=1 Tax=Acetohalobium arabaticum (strain ATCC 49924 / DSM 5501 / Z-7288) TaxID=574087 RepID=D9QUN3_ACEAZ|nr:ribonuclease P protein component [Acetohalobium arabaticum]ADL13834.1 ribonuclease P protein component [Acetohalobium arabaticum DSM 5501]